MLEYWVYILNCENNKLYTGYTTDIVRRYQEHLLGTNCKYTRSFKPLSIAACWKILATKSEALKIEHFIKKMTRKQKNQLILNPDQLSDFFCCSFIPVENLKIL